jgi:hypothetical protein
MVQCKAYSLQFGRVYRRYCVWSHMCNTGLLNDWAHSCRAYLPIYAATACVDAEAPARIILLIMSQSCFLGLVLYVCRRSLSPWRDHEWRDRLLSVFALAPSTLHVIVEPLPGVNQISTEHHPHQNKNIATNIGSGGDTVRSRVAALWQEF